MAFEGFETRRFDVDGIGIHARIGGSGPALLLLHGFPQTHFIWHGMVDALTLHFTVVCPDLRGYGDSDKPAGLADHGNYSKRVMARDMVGVMDQLGHDRFSVVGHDRGGRVAHRLAVDHPARVERLALLDISPTLTMYEGTNMAFARAYFHWFFLIQPAPFPETLIGADAPGVLRNFLGGWGGDLSAYAPQALAEYQRCWCTPQAIHASCEDYRAAAGIDLEHDRASDAAGDRIRCPVHVLWGERGVVAMLFDPLRDWQAKSAATVTGRALPAGHFIPDEQPRLLLDELLPFLRG